MYNINTDSIFVAMYIFSPILEHVTITVIITVYMGIWKYEGAQLPQFSKWRVQAPPPPAPPLLLRP